MVPDAKKLIRLMPIIGLNLDQQMRIREIRNQEAVRKWMYTDHIISVTEHLDWINRLKSDIHQIVFAVIFDGETDPIGMVSINAINHHHRRADWAFYLSEAMAGKGIGSALAYAAIEFAFTGLGLEKLNCEAIEGNDLVLRLYEKFLLEEEGFRWSNIIKNGKRIGVHFMGVTAEEWNKNKPEKPDRYEIIFDTHLKAQSSDSIIDRIESARSRNNLNWMNVLRLALDKAPETALAVIEEIHKTDAEINQLSGELFK